jgi:hypothetical protein
MLGPLRARNAKSYEFAAEFDRGLLSTTGLVRGEQRLPQQYQEGGGYHGR